MTSYTEDVSSDENIKFEDGQFNDAAKWIAQAGWIVAGGIASFFNFGNVFTSLGQLRPELIEDNFYDVTFTISNAAFVVGDGIALVCSGNWGTEKKDTNGTHTLRIQCGNGVKKMSFQNFIAQAGSGCDIDDVSFIAIGTEFYIDTEIDHRTPRAAVRYSVPDGDKIYHALSYRDKTNCMIKYTP